MKSLALSAAALFVLSVPTFAQQKWHEKDYQRVLCDGMALEIALPENGGKADCVSDTHIIEVDWTDQYKAAIGQALNYSQKSDLIPGIILICRRREALCLQHALNTEETMAAYGSEATIWRCGLDARALSDCLERHLPAKR